MARGSIAKDFVMKKIAAAFGADAIGEFDKKYYVWANDGGERVQIAISLTCPKTFIEVAANVDTDGGDWDFNDDAPTNTKVAVANAAPAEISEEEQNNLKALMDKLGL
jgi:hypothetical protein